MKSTVEKKITMIDVDKISPSAYNPPKRTSTASIKDLKNSIEEVGIIYPILVSEKLGVIDGHRRLACAKALNFKTIPCIVIRGDSTTIFDEVNRTSIKLSNKDNLFVFLSGGPISKKAQKEIDEIQKLLSRDDLIYAADARVSTSGLLFSMDLLKKYIGTKESEFWKKAARWVIYNNQSYAIRMAITNKMDKRLMIAAIEANSPIN